MSRTVKHSDFIFNLILDTMLELSLFSLSFSIVAILVVGKLFGVSRKLGRAKVVANSC